jgi:predicted exporter
MKTDFDCFGDIYGRLGQHRRVLFTVTIVVIAASLFMSWSGGMDEDISAMLPDGESRVASDFALLQQTPFSKKGVISLSAAPGIGTEALLQATDRLAASMKPPFFLKTVKGPDASLGPDTVELLLDVLPAVATGKDLKALEESLTPQTIRTKLSDMRKEIQSPAGWMMKDLFQKDPLGLRLIAFKKLEALRLVPNARIEDNHFVDSDGRHALIIAEMGPKITDSGSSRLMLENFTKAVKESVPKEIAATMVSGHQYTVANADTIKKDLVLVLGCSVLAMAVLYVAFLHSWRSIFVFLVPTIVLAFGTAAVLIVHKNVSSATVGFASVLLGITDDFPIYVYLALKNGRDKAESLNRISRPLLFSGLTILAAFSVMLFSALPGQRQIGLFSIVCIVGSIGLSLIVLPHVIDSKRVVPSQADVRQQNPMPLAPRLIVSVWALALVVCLWQGTNVRFNGDIRAMSYVPETLKAAEQEVGRIWGNFRDTAVVFSNGRDLNAALEVNEYVLQRVEAVSPAGLVSLAPLLPSRVTQDRNRTGWNQFWKRAEGRTIIDRLQIESETLGFSRDAFKPFENGLFASASAITADLIGKAGLGDLTEMLLLRDRRGVTVLTLVPDVAEVRETLAEDKGPLMSSVRVVSPTGFREALSRIISHDFLWYVVYAFLMIVAMLLVLFRDLRRTGYALVPVITGMVFMIGAMTALGISFNIFNIVAAVLVIGLGVDFGIFMVYRVTEGHDRTTDLSVLLGGLTTVAGIGMLVLARHPALHSIGTTVLLGLAGAVPSALLVIPALYYLISEKGNQRIETARRQSSIG